MKKQNQLMQSYGVPYLEWQTGQYERFARFCLIPPYRFLLLCRLIETFSQKMPEDFMAILGCERIDHQLRYTAQKHLKYYFLANGYGQQYYTRRQLHRLFYGYECHQPIVSP